MQKITPFLWYNDNAGEAMDFYISVFKDARVVNVSRMGDKIFTGTFELFGQQFHFLNGGPQFKFTEAVSFFVNCETQEEVDEYWEKLSEGGEESRCGWLKDKFGLSWQIIPTALGQLMGDPDREKAGRVMQAMLKMDKIIIADLQSAYDGN
jgi:predicted 3-demethylubiquinone-9 3-methyltransferase (glyoxalase superfamily)